MYTTQYSSTSMHCLMRKEIQVLRRYVIADPNNSPATSPFLPMIHVGRLLAWIGRDDVKHDDKRYHYVF